MASRDNLNNSSSSSRGRYPISISGSSSSSSSSSRRPVARSPFLRPATSDPEPSLEGGLRNLNLSSLHAPAPEPSILNASFDVEPPRLHPERPLSIQALHAVNRISILISNPVPADPTELQTLRAQLRHEHARNPTRARTTAFPIAVPNSSSSSRTVHHFPRPPLTPSEFRGHCSVCYEDDVPLCLLFKGEPCNLITYNSSNIYPNPRYPFLAGHPNNDIISAFLCCINCSSYFIETRLTPLRESCIAIFPLTSYVTNENTWISTLRFALPVYYKSRHPDRLLAAWLSIVHWTLTTKGWAQPDGSEENLTRSQALSWLRGIILSEVTYNGDGYNGLLKHWIPSILYRPKTSSSWLFIYPIAGFPVLVGLAWVCQEALKPRVQPDTHQAHSQRRSSREKLALAIWKRILTETIVNVFTLVRTTPDPLILIHDKISLINTTLLTLPDPPNGTPHKPRFLHILVHHGLLEKSMVEDLYKAAPSQLGFLEHYGRWAMVFWCSWLPEMAGSWGAKEAWEVFEEVVERWPRLLLVREFGKGWLEGVAERQVEGEVKEEKVVEQEREVQQEEGDQQEQVQGLEREPKTTVEVGGSSVSASGNVAPEEFEDGRWRKSRRTTGYREMNRAVESEPAAGCGDDDYWDVLDTYY